jgi:hypothetical protein
MDVKSAFFNRPIKEKVYVVALRMIGIPTMCISSLRRSMALSKHQEHGMNALETSLFLMLSRSRKWNLLFSLRHVMVIFICQIYVDYIIFGSTNQKS